MAEGTSSGNYPKNIREAQMYINKYKLRSRNKSYDDLAALESELRRAYVKKELEAQIMERKAEECMESMRDKGTTELMKLKEQISTEEDLEKVVESIEKSKEYKRHLDDQVSLRHQRNQILTEEARIEREILREVDKLREESENSKRLTRRIQLSENVRKELLIFQEIKEIRKEEEEYIEDKKSLEDFEYLKKIDERVETVKRLRDEYDRRREQVLLRVTSYLMDVEARKKERESVLKDLVTEELQYELLLKEERERIKKENARKDLIDGLKEQIDFVEKCKVAFVRRDALFAEEIMKKIMDDDRSMRLTIEARRRQRLQYRKDLECLIQDRRRIREEEIAKIKEDIEEECRIEMTRRDRISRERKELLKEHIDIVNFVRRDVLTDEELGIIDELRLKSDDKKSTDN